MQDHMNDRDTISDLGFTVSPPLLHLTSHHHSLPWPGACRPTALSVRVHRDRGWTPRASMMSPCPNIGRTGELLGPLGGALAPSSIALCNVDAAIDEEDVRESHSPQHTFDHSPWSTGMTGQAWW